LTKLTQRKKKKFKKLIKKAKNKVGSLYIYYFICFIMSLKCFPFIFWKKMNNILYKHERTSLGARSPICQARS